LEKKTEKNEAEKAQNRRNSLTSLLEAEKRGGGQKGSMGWVSHQRLRALLQRPHTIARSDVSR